MTHQTFSSHFDVKQSKKPGFQILWLCILCISGYHLLPAQSHGSIRFKNYTTADGLAHNVGFEILQNVDGFIWIGTDYGLSRFDGFAFKNYHEEQGLKTPFVISLDEASDGTIHIGTYGGGHHFMHEDSIRQYKAGSSGRLNQIDVLKDGTVLIDKGKPGASQLFIKTPRDSQFVRITFFQHADSIGYFYWRQPFFLEETEFLSIEQKSWGNLITTDYKKNSFQIYSYCVTQNEKVWMTTNHGVYQLSFQDTTDRFIIYIPTPEKKLLERKAQYLPKKEKKLSKRDFYSIAEDTQGNLWLGGKGIFAMLPETGDEAILFMKNLPPKNISRFALAQSGKIAIAASDNIVAAQKEDLYIYNTMTNGITHLNSLLGLKSTLSHLFFDREDNLWLSTHGSGIYCIFPQKSQSYTLESGLTNSYIRDILEMPDGSIWASTQSGLNVFQNNTWKPYPWFQSNDFTPSRFILTQDGQIAVAIEGDGRGRLFLVQSDESPPLPASFHYSLGMNFFLDSSGYFWSRNRLWDQIHDNAAEAPKTDTLPITNNVLLELNQRIPNYSISSSKHFHFTFHKDTIWLGTRGQGLFKIFGDSLIHYTQQTGLPSNWINDLKIAPNGALWAGTKNGFFELSEGSIRNYTTHEGLSSNHCQVIYFDHRGTLWIGTPKGLHYFQDGRISTINSREGLVADQINCLFEDSQKQLWIGTSQGITVIDNNIPQQMDLPPGVHLEKIELDGKKVEKAQLSGILPKTQLAIHYTSIAFQNPVDITFQYRLGSNEEWITTKNRSVILQNLEEGSYHFEVRAKKLNSDWGNSQELFFEVQPPWWASKRFGLVGGLLFGVLISIIPFLWARRRQRKKIAEAQIQNKLARLELKALQAQMNPHFVFNSLNAIMHFIMTEDKLQANLYLSKFARLMRMFLDASKSNYLPLADELELLALYVELELLRFKDKFVFNLEIDESIPLESTEVPSMILQPFIENAINHGLAYKKKNGLLLLRATPVSKGKYLSFIIEDNGIGRVEAARIRKNSLKKHKSHATNIIEDRISILNGAEPDHIKIEITDLVDQEGNTSGTRVEVKISILH